MVKGVFRGADVMGTLLASALCSSPWCLSAAGWLSASDAAETPATRHPGDYCNAGNRLAPGAPTVMARIVAPRTQMALTPLPLLCCEEDDKRITFLSPWMAGTCRPQ